MGWPLADIHEPSVIPNHHPPLWSHPSKPSQIAHLAHLQTCPDFPDKYASTGKVFSEGSPTGPSID